MSVLSQPSGINKDHKQSARPWSVPETLELIRARHGNTPHNAIAEQLGRTNQSCRLKQHNTHREYQDNLKRIAEGKPPKKPHLFYAIDRFLREHTPVASHPVLAPRQSQTTYPTGAFGYDVHATAFRPLAPQPVQYNQVRQPASMPPVDRIGLDTLCAAAAQSRPAAVTQAPATIPQAPAAVTQTPAAVTQTPPQQRHDSIRESTNPMSISSLMNSGDNTKINKESKEK